MSVLSAIICVILSSKVSSQIQQIAAPQLSGQQKFRPWINPGPPYVDAQLINDAVQKRTNIIKPTKQHSRPERRIQSGEFKFFLPGLGIVKDYVPTQLSKRPQRQSVISRLKVNWQVEIK